MRLLSIEIAIILCATWGFVACAGTRAASSADSAEPVEIANPASTGGWIERWYCCGPFERSGSPALLARWAQPFSDAAQRCANLASERYGAVGGPAGWSLESLIDTTAASADPATGKQRSLPVRMIDFQKICPQRTVDSSAYALAFIRMSSAQDCLIELGSDDGVRLWLNGRLIHEFAGKRPLVPGEDLTPAHMGAGLNALLVEVVNEEGYWGFSLRLRGKGESQIDSGALIGL